MLHVHDFVLPLHANSDPPPPIPRLKKTETPGNGFTNERNQRKVQNVLFGHFAMFTNCN